MKRTDGRPPAFSNRGHYHPPLLLRRLVLAETTDGQGATAARYLPNVGGAPLAQHTFRVLDCLRDPADTTGEWRWLLPDTSGNVATQLADSGEVEEQAAFDPFGRPLQAGASEGAGAGSVFGFQGDLTDGATGSLLLGPRQYDPQVARFSSPDYLAAASLDLALGVDSLTGNRYLFAGANPVAFYENGYLPCLLGGNNRGGCRGGRDSGIWGWSSLVDTTTNPVATWRAGYEQTPVWSRITVGALILIPAAVIACSAGGCVALAAAGPALVRIAPKAKDYVRRAVNWVGPANNPSNVTRSSTTLARNLERAGFTRPSGFAAHHIVARKAPQAARARAVLERFGVGINDKMNGVFLPGTQGAPNPAGAAVHSTLHTNRYYNLVNELLLGATSRPEVVDVLSYVRQRLLSGNL